ncbi:MAG: hypothetical protein R3B82_30055 [Sandaracinaceae bacterium]
MTLRHLRLPLAALALALVVPSCGGGAGGSIRPRYHAATGSSLRYHTVLRTLPAGRPGRTISAASTVAVRRAGESFDVTVTWAPVHVAGEGDSLVEVHGDAVARFVRDGRRRIEGAPRVEGDVEAAHDLARVLAEDLVLPETELSVGDTWSLDAIERPTRGEGRVRIERTARLEAVEDGVARVAVAGTTEGQTLDQGGVSIAVTATVAQTFRVRVADAVLVELESHSEVALSTPVGRAVDVEDAHVTRILGTMPRPERHAFTPGHHPTACAQRLRAMGQRFERTPRALDLDGWAGLEVTVPVRPSGQPIDEAGPILVGTDEETLLGAAAIADVAHTVVVYVVAPDRVSDADIRGWLDGVVAPGIELRRVVQGQVHPPSPEPSAEVLALDGRMHASHSVDPWRGEVRSLIALCDEAVEAFEVAEAAEPNERAAATRRGLLAAFGRCGCETTDLARLERTLDLRLGGPELGWEPVP